MPRLKSLVAALLILCLGIGAAHAESIVVTAPHAPIKRGVNVLGYDPIWKDPAKGRFQEKHFDAIRAAGFDFIRVNLHGFRHMDAQNRLSVQWFERVDWIVNEATEAGLKVILDEHDFNSCAQDVVACRSKLTAFWRQVAPRYRDRPSSLIFEPLNEPYGPLDAPTWNRMFAELLAIIRETNPTRTVVVGPTRWNNFRELPTLELPAADRNLLVTFHYYDPFRFTHQGTSWTDLKELRGVTWGSDEDKAQLKADFDQVLKWAQVNERPILLGEFAAYDRADIPIEMRAAYANSIAREAERRGFAWSYWQFDSDFVLWDMNKDGWVEPILEALTPPNE
jgi:endoglucanase